ncbi:MAG: holo-ACP synthase [bacterium]|nr:holo-ACP synthase [bacterium]
MLGLGIDEMEVARLQSDLEAKTGLRDELFTPGEIAYCESKRYPAPHFAGRFCAKEALFKALGTGYREGMSWREIEVTNDSLGKPLLSVSGKVQEKIQSLGVDNIFISISHTRDHAIAIVILEANR